MALKISSKLKAGILVGVATLLLIIWQFRKEGIRNNEPGTVVASFRIIPETADSAKLVSDRPKIPRIIHQIWKTHEVPYVVRNWVQSWTRVNPTWEYWFWTDEDMRNLISMKYPSFLDLYDSYPSGGYRADAFRYFLMYEHGGVYADLDAESLQPLDPITSKHECIITQEPLEHAHFLNGMSPPLVSNAIIACRPRHGFFHHMIKDLRSFTGVFRWNDILHATGPYMMTEVFRGYTQGTHWFSPSQEDVVFLVEPHTFLPTLDNSMLDRMREMCLHSEGRTFLSKEFLELQQQLCQKLTGFNYKNEPKSDSYTDHHWTHLWAGRRYDPWGVHNTDMTYNVKEMEKNLPPMKLKL